ncbi:hypothetical protein HO133_000402 [Letharia lupina]|uniref:Uncharacterized protein n=1 Tax=Letharia lupina TaxID=560253 RepID=A0A8H6CHF4_9LECA|nr:uncharacterized protein HO133_000402 [Letharia lupina]KAF6223559.1 hypothetical protein HO133_000402 [Letharia lupina]
MPRTVWKQTDPRLKDDPQWNNPSYLRACAEEAHYEPQRNAFHIPLYIHPASPTDAARRLDFRDHFNRSVARRLDQLSPDDGRAFCWKDCAIYGNGGLTGKDHVALLDDVYREWFPHRAQDKDVSEGSFFGKFMRFTPPVGTLQEIVRFHAALCEKLCELEKEIPDTKPVDPCEVRPGQARSVAEYKLRETFSMAFIVLDTGWQERGVLLAWRSEDLASRYSCEEGGEITGYDGSDGGDLGQTCVFRCPLKRAMQLIVSADPERAKRRAEYNEMLEETLGEDDDDDDDDQE